MSHYADSGYSDLPSLTIFQSKFGVLCLNTKELSI